MLLERARLQVVTAGCVQDPEQLQESANQILTAIIQGMRKEEPSNNVKLAATNALLNSLEFTKANFEKEVDDPLATGHWWCWCDWTGLWCWTHSSSTRASQPGGPLEQVS